MYAVLLINAKLPQQPLTFMASKISVFPITKELYGLFCWSDFWYQKFSAPKDHLGSILRIQIYQDRGCWPFWGLGVKNPKFYNLRLCKDFHYSSSLWPMLFLQTDFFFTWKIWFFEKTLLLYWHMRPKFLNSRVKLKREQSFDTMHNKGQLISEASFKSFHLNLKPN